jgi:uncharacterized protein
MIEAQALARCIAWLELAVIGLNLCPFAKAVHKKQQILWQLSHAQSFDEIDLALEALMLKLSLANPVDIDTAVLILPQALLDFFDFNIYLAQANARLRQLNLQGVLQIASFHPQYCFEGKRPDDLSNASNQSPYPMLHLLREASLTQAIANYPETDLIVARNQARLENLKAEGWAALKARIESRASGTANESRGSGTADESRGSGTADESRASGTADESRASATKPTNEARSP